MSDEQPAGKPSAEATIRAAMKAAFAESNLGGAPGCVAPDDLVCWSVYEKHLAVSIRSFAARRVEQAVAQERERCLWWRRSAHWEIADEAIESGRPKP